MSDRTPSNSNQASASSPSPSASATSPSPSRINRSPSIPTRRHSSRRSVNRTNIRRFSGHFLDDHSFYYDDDESSIHNDDDEDEELSELRRAGTGLSINTVDEHHNDCEQGQCICEEDAKRLAQWDDADFEDVFMDYELQLKETFGEVDLEKVSMEIAKTRTKDPNLVTWEPNDPENPKNWTRRQKWAATLILSSFAFLTPISSSMIAPAIPAISTEFNISSAVEAHLTLSVFVLAFAVGPLILGPMSEIYGRVPVLQLSNMFYLIFNIACGVCQSKEQMIAFRFLAGLGGSAPLALGGGVLSDCWSANERGKSIAIYSLGPLLGPAIGPIVGAFVSEHATWRWVFYGTSIIDAVVQICGAIFIRETYEPTLLRRRCDKLKKSTGNDRLYTQFDTNETPIEKIKTAMVRPFIMLFTQNIIQVVGLYMCFLYGMMYLVISTFPTVWTKIYHQSVSMGGLNYISLGLGFFLGTQICAPLNDVVYRCLTKRNSGLGIPEFRVPLMLPASLLVPIGLTIYGWCVQYKTHWIWPNVGTTIFAAGVIVGFQSLQTYTVDAYPRYAASAIGAATVLRSLAGFAFPLWAPYLFESKLEYGWGNTLLVGVAVLVGWPAPYLLWKFGAMLRARSTFAAG